jgi:hypothetical protein
MKIFNLNLNHYNLFCPVTGDQIMSPDFMDESPAMVFNWLDSNDDFTEITEEIEQLINECEKDIAGEKYPDYPFEYFSDFGQAFELLINEKLKPFSNYVLYAIRYDNGPGRANSDAAYFAFDMGYGKNLQGKELNENYFISNSFYCPVTGEKLFEKGFKLEQFPPSLEVYYILNTNDDQATIIHLSEFIQKQLNKKGINIIENKCSGTLMQNIIRENCYSDYALHAFTSTESKDDLKHCYLIYMNYFEEEEESPYEHLPDISTFNSVLDKYKNNEPQIDGYAICIKQKPENTSSFLFYNSTPKPYVSFEEWEELMPTIIFSDFKNKPYSDIPSAKFEELNSLFCSYCLGGWGTSAADPKGIEQLKEFMEYTNEALDESEILFLGSIEQLFIANTEFTTTLITKFGKNPKENTTEYLKFLKEYKN